MLKPRKFKFRKAHRGRLSGTRTRGVSLAFGEYGLKALSSGWITARQMESGRRAITGYAKRGGKVWIRFFPDKPISARPAETRMGGGKGAVSHWVAVVKSGKILYEVADLPEDVAMEALRRASHKLGIPTKIVRKSDNIL